ncbi:hypothetical protein GCM10009674_08320 [Nesterenkonia xinjiangensis]
MCHTGTPDARLFCEERDHARIDGNGYDVASAGRSTGDIDLAAPTQATGCDAKTLAASASAVSQDRLLLRPRAHPSGPTVTPSSLPPWSAARHGDSAAPLKSPAHHSAPVPGMLRTRRVPTPTSVD